MKQPNHIRQQFGVLGLDLPRLAWCLARPGGWLHYRNRIDNLKISPDGRAVACQSQWGSNLHAMDQFPALSWPLMRRALRAWPVRLSRTPVICGAPQLSFILPHRGRLRLPLLHITIESILAQREVPVECMVVEQNERREIFDLPRGVRYLHLPHPKDPVSWRKSWAYNEGVRLASTEIVVCHDGDIPVPTRYAVEILRQFREHQWDAVFPQRFLFYLNSSVTREIIAQRSLPLCHLPECVRQNWKGGTLAIRKEAYWKIGGFDEQFIDWTGEDLEFHDRCLELNCFDYGYIPFLHLWHPPQETKLGLKREQNLAEFHNLMQIPRAERIRRLVGQT
ncbi:MAG: glycosyltransferase [Verrucomicrobiota bacterium]